LHYFSNISAPNSRTPVVTRKHFVSYRKIVENTLLRPEDSHLQHTIIIHMTRAHVRTTVG